MPVHISIGIKASSTETVSEALRRETGLQPEPHDSLFLGDYDLFRIPEAVRVGYNFVDAEGEWFHSEHIEYGVLLVVENTERPDFFRALAVKLGFENKVIEEKTW